MTTRIEGWWLCPNEPRCGHGACFHDIEDFDDDSPRCCVEGCDCGDPMQVLQTTPCTACRGVGYFDDVQQKPCPTCGGKGFKFAQSAFPQEAGAHPHSHPPG